MSYRFEMHKILVAVCSVAMMTVLTGCFNFGSNKSKIPEMLLVNVLDKEFYDDCHISGSIHVSLSDFQKTSDSWPKTTKVVLYCSNYSCTASTSMCRKLIKKGFEFVRDYEEGMAGWYQEHLKNPDAYPVEGPCKSSYLTMENNKLEGIDMQGVQGITTQELKSLLDQHNEQAA